MPELTGITEFSAAYLFLILAIIFDVMAMVWRKGYFFMLSMVGWFFMGFYVYAVSAGNATVIMLGTFCLLVAFVNIVLLVALKPKAEIPPEVSMQERSAQYMEWSRQQRYGGRPGYDNTGKRESGW